MVKHVLMVKGVLWVKVHANFSCAAAKTLNQLKKPMEINGRCTCIIVQLQLEDCSYQRCQILAASQEKLA